MISEGLDRELGWSENVAVRVHLLMCDGCRNFAQQMRALRTFARAFSSRADHAADSPDG